MDIADMMQRLKRDIHEYSIDCLRIDFFNAAYDFYEQEKTAFLGRRKISNIGGWPRTRTDD